MFADGLRQTDKWGETAAERFADEPVDQHGHVFDGEAGLEDRAECFLERVGAPYLAARSAQLAQGGGLLIVEAFGCFEQRPARFIEPAGGVAVADSTRAEHARIGGLEQPLTYGPNDGSSTPSPSVSASRRPVVPHSRLAAVAMAHGLPLDRCLRPRQAAGADRLSHSTCCRKPPRC